MRKQVSTRIEYIFDQFYAEKAEERFSFLVDFANKFCASLDVGTGIQSYVSREKIHALVRSHFLDIIKFKEYHSEPTEPGLGLTHVNSRHWMEAVHSAKELSRNKVAAFTAKWIMKHAPLAFFVEDNATVSFQDSYKIVSANAVFAARVCLEFLKLDIMRIDANKFERFVYHLMYRSLDDRALFGWLESFQELPMLTKKPTYNVFVVSPSDCAELRRATERAIVEVNKLYPAELKLNSYMWENDKQVGATVDYQGDVFREATDKWGGAECDVLICFVWKKFGVHTELEFNKYFTAMVGKVDKSVCFCRYNEPTSTADVDAESLGRLNLWVSAIQDRVAPLGRARDSIASVAVFEQELRYTLLMYLKRQESALKARVSDVD